MDCKVVSLFSLAEWKNGLAFRQFQFSSSGKPIIKIAELKNGITGQTAFTQQEFDKSVHLTKGDMVFSWSGNPGTSIDVFWYDLPDGWLNQHIFKVTPAEGVNKLYLFYLLKFLKPQFTAIAANKQTTGLGHVTVKDMKELMVALPDIETQRLIGEYLYAIDRKAYINNRINDNLQQQIKSLVTAWLVDYIPFGGEMPSDWCTISLATIADFVSGYSYKGAELQPSTTAMATIKNFDRNGGFKLDGFKELVPSSKIKPCHYAEKFDVIVSHTDLTQKAEVIGNAEPIINLSGYESIVFSMDLVKVVPKDTRVSKFLLAALLQHPRFKAHCLGYVNGTTVLHLSKKALPDYELDFPTDPAVLVPLDDALRVLYMQMATIVDENRKLQDLRDTLLPRLMSGQIDVTDIDF